VGSKRPPVDIVLERWEGKFYQATAGFQEQIEATSAFDLVWASSGSGLELNCRPISSAVRMALGSRVERVLELESALEASDARTKQRVNGPKRRGQTINAKAQSDACLAEVARATRRLWRRRHLSYNQTKYVVERVRRALGVAPP
jgi:hypothetical protein